MLRRGDRRGRDARGAVTAEIALGLPLLLAVTVTLVWLLVVGVAQARVVDAAREGARVLARGDSVAEATARAREVAPLGAEVSAGRSGGSVEVRVEARVEGPGGLLGRLPGATVHARATAVAE
jgi:Flp pilus assembly protein TadG